MLLWTAQELAELYSSLPECRPLFFLDKEQCSDSTSQPRALLAELVLALETSVLGRELRVSEWEASAAKPQEQTYLNQTQLGSCALWREEWSLGRRILLCFMCEHRVLPSLLP